MRLRELKLPVFLAHAPTVALEAERAAWSLSRYLYPLAEVDLEARRQRRRQRRHQEAGLPASTTLATVPVACLPTPLRRQLPTRGEGRFVEPAQNSLAFGLPGRGKTHLRCAVGQAWVERGSRVLFLPA